MKKINSITIRLLALIVVLSLLVPSPVFAATGDTVQPYASKYITSYNTYICAVGSGDIQIWFEIMGTGDMDELGTLSIVLYESTNNSTWTEVETYFHEDYSSMLIEDDYWHMDYVPYDGVAGRYYKAYVCLWAGKNNNGDTRYMWATSVRAT